MLKCHFVCAPHRSPVTAHADHADAGPGPGTSVIAGPAAAASCVLDVWGGSAVRELDLGAISMRHAMRDDGIGSRQEQLSLVKKPSAAFVCEKIWLASVRRVGHTRRARLHPPFSLSELSE